MTTVKLHWIQSQSNDPFTRDTYSIEGSGFNVSEFAYVNAAEEFVLPEGYSIGETVAGEIGIFDDNGFYCVLDRHNKRPRLSSADSVVYLKKRSD